MDYHCAVLVESDAGRSWTTPGHRDCQEGRRRPEVVDRLHQEEGLVDLLGLVLQRVRTDHQEQVVHEQALQQECLEGPVI